MKLIGILKRLVKRKDNADRLYYLTGIKSIRTNKRVLNECTVTKK